MVRGDGEQAEVIAFAVRRAATCLGEAQGIKRVNALWRFDAADFFPLQTLVTVKLVPAQLQDFAQRIEGRMALWFLQIEQLLFEDWVVQVKAYQAVVRAHQPRSLGVKLSIKVSI